MCLLEGLRDLPLKKLRNKTNNKIKYKQQALITAKINVFFQKNYIKTKSKKASNKINQDI